MSQTPAEYLLSNKSVVGEPKKVSPIKIHTRLVLLSTTKTNKKQQNMFAYIEVRSTPIHVDTNYDSGDTVRTRPNVNRETGNLPQTHNICTRTDFREMNTNGTNTMEVRTTSQAVKPKKKENVIYKQKYPP